MKAVISLNRATSNHGPWLMNKGYQVEEAEINKTNFRTGKTYRSKVWMVEINGFVTGEFKFDTREDLLAFLREIAENKKALSYTKTKIKLPGENRHHQNKWLAQKLGPASALIMGTYREDEQTTQSIGYDF